MDKITNLALKAIVFVLMVGVCTAPVNEGSEKSGYTSMSPDTDFNVVGLYPEIFDPKNLHHIKSWNIYKNIVTYCKS